MALVPEADCLAQYNDPDDDVLALNLHVCTNTEPDVLDTTNRGYCDGDAGGPLYDDDGGRNRVIGIATPVNGTCANNNVYDVYADVCSYRNWIDAGVDALKADNDQCNVSVGGGGGGGCCAAIQRAAKAAYSTIAGYFA